MSIRSLIVKVGAETQAIDAAFARIGQHAKRTEADLQKIGSGQLGQGAQRSLQDLESAMAAITRGQERIAERSRLAAVGLDQIGGAARLTKGQLAEMQRTIEAGLDAYRALGQQAPKDLQRVATAIAQQRRALDGAQQSTSLFGQAQGLLLSRVVALAGPSALGLAVKQTIAYADSLTKLSDRTGIGTEQLQRLEAVAAASGNSIEEVGASVNSFQKALVSGTADETIRRIGLSVAELRQLSPDDQFFAIAKAIQAIPDPAQQAAAAMELFGRGGAALLPTLKADVDALADSTVRMSASTVKTLDDAGDAFGRFKTSGLNAIGEIAAGAINLVAAIAKIPGAVAAAAQGASAAAPRSVAVPDMLVGGAVSDELKRSLTPQQLAALVRGEGVMLPSRPRPSVGAGVQALPVPSAEEERALVAQIEREIAARNEAGRAGREHAQALKLVTDKIAEATRPIVTLTDRQKDLAVTYRDLGLSSREIALAIGASRTSVEAYTDDLDSSIAAIERNREVTGRFQQDLGKLAVGFNKAGTATVGFRGVMTTLPLLEARDQTEGLADGFRELAEIAPRTTTGVEAYRTELDEAVASSEQMSQTIAGLATAFAQMAQVSGGAFGGVAQEIATIVTALDLATKAAKAYGEAQTKAAKAVALASGAAALAQATGSGSTLGRVVGGAGAGAQIGGAIGGPIGAGIGAVGGGLLGLFRGLGNSERQINPIREAFVQAAGGLDELNRKAQRAGLTLNRLLDARTPEQYKRAIDELTAAFEFQGSAMDTLQATIDKYGFSINELGPAFQRQELDKQAQSLFQDYQVLTAAGIEHGVVLGKMAEGVNEYVQNARRFGTEVPSAMRPMLQQMIDLGLLTDENGVAFASLEESGITFAETLSEGFTRVVDEVKKLTDAIARGLGIAIDNLPRHVPVDVDVTYRLPDFAPIGDGIVIGAASGGRVTTHGLQRFAGGGRVLPFIRRGTDTVPAMLTPGEVVLNAAQQGRVAAALIQGGGSPVIINVQGYVDSPAAQRRLGQVVNRELGRRVRTGQRVGSL